jgi:hypothetical protein
MGLIKDQDILGIVAQAELDKEEDLGVVEAGWDVIRGS